MVRKLAGTLATVGMLSSPLAFALGLGEAELFSSLNQPFKARIQLAQAQGVDADDIRVQLADERAFAKAGLDRQFFLQNLKFNVRSAGGQPYIELSSSVPVKEPFLNFLLEVEWPQGQLMREYTFLIDPPTFNNTLTQQYAQTSQTSPQLAAPAAGNLVEEGARRIKIGPTDTLWSLARKNRPDNRVTIKQAMLAIQDANPDAFPTGNINNMEAGSTILIPNRKAMTERSAGSASREVARQNKAWVAFKAQSVAGDTRTAPVKKADPVDSKPLKLVAEDEQSPADSQASVRQELALSKESLDQSAREKAELNSRLDELQKQVNTLQKLIRLKDEQLAAMEAMLAKQNQLLAGKSADEAEAEQAAPDAAEAVKNDTAETKDSTVTPDVPEASVASAATTGKVAGGAIALDLAAESAKQSSDSAEPEAGPESKTEAGSTDAQPEAEEQKPAAFSLDKQESEELDTSSFLTDTLKNNAVLLGGGAAGILALILLMMVLRRRRNSKADKGSESSLDGSDMLAGAAGGAAGMAALDAMSDDDLPDDLSLDDDLSSDLDDDSLSLGDDLSDDSLSLDDLGEADLLAEKSDDAIEDLGDFDLGDLADEADGEAVSDGETLDLDDELDLSDLDFSEDFELGDLDESDSDGESKIPFAQAELTEDTASTEERDAGESVQDNLMNPEGDLDIQPEQDDTPDAIDFPDSGSETDALSTLDLAEDIPEQNDSLQLAGDADTSPAEDLSADSDELDVIDLTGDDLSSADDDSSLQDLLADAETSDEPPAAERDSDDDGLIDLEGDDLSDLDLLVDDAASEPAAEADDDDDDLLAALADEAQAEADADTGPVDVSELDITDIPSDRSDLDDSDDTLTGFDDSDDDDLLEELMQESRNQDDAEPEQDLSALDAGLPGMASADPVADALQDAQAHRELGQPEQAAAILQSLLNEQPQDNAVRLQFMEVLVDLGDDATFDHELRQLQDSGSAKELSQALALQQELYLQMGDRGLAPETDFASPDDLEELNLSPAHSAGNVADDETLDLNSELDALGRDFDRYADETPAQTSDRSELDEQDFELTDLDLDDSAQDDEPLINLNSQELGEPEPLDDADFELTDMVDADDLSDYAFDDNQEALRSDTKEYIEDLGDLSMSARQSSADSAAMEEMVGRDLMDDDDIVDLSPDIDLEDDLADLGDLSDISLADDNSSSQDQLNIDDLLDENEDPAIKLDLARAYVEMGNTASAIEALEDVQLRGNADQKEEAGQLMAKLQAE